MQTKRRRQRKQQKKKKHSRSTVAKKQLCTCSTLFSQIFFAVVLHDDNVTDFQKLPSYAFYGGNVVCGPVHLVFAAAHFYTGGK